LHFAAAASVVSKYVDVLETRVQPFARFYCPIKVVDEWVVIGFVMGLLPVPHMHLRQRGVWKGLEYRPREGKTPGPGQTRGLTSQVHDHVDLCAVVTRAELKYADVASLAMVTMLFVHCQHSFSAYSRECSYAYM
jgi:hypothetical protein